MNNSQSSSPGCLARAIALLFAFLFILSASLFLLAWTFNRLAFDPQTVQNALVKADFYSRIPALIADQITYSMNYNPCQQNPAAPECQGESGQSDSASGPPQFMKNLTQKDWQELLAPLLPESWLKAQADSAFQQLFDYLNGQGDQLSIFISLKEFKTRLAGPEGTAAIQTLLEKQPDCTRDQEVLLAAMIAAGKTKDLPLCNPPDKMMAVMLPYLTEAMVQAVKEIPDRLELASTSQEQAIPGPDTNTTEARNSLRLIRRFIQAGLLLPLIFFFLMSIAGIRSVPGWLQWWGLPILITGLILLVLSAAGFLGTVWLVDSLIQSGRISGSGISPDLLKVGLSAGGQILRTFITWIGVEGGVLSLVGLILAGLGWALAGLSRRGIINA